jgi:hypothetical protein
VEVFGRGPIVARYRSIYERVLEKTLGE